MSQGALAVAWVAPLSSTSTAFTLCEPTSMPTTYVIGCVTQPGGGSFQELAAPRYPWDWPATAALRSMRVFTPSLR